MAPRPVPSLPPALDATSIEDLVDVPPEVLVLDQTPLRGHSPAARAARSLRYSRSGPTDVYDEIGFRYLASNPTLGPVPLQTSASARAHQQELDLRRADPLLEELRAQQESLRHRPLSVPDGRLRYTVHGALLDVRLVQDLPGGGELEEPWPVPLSRPPQFLLDGAVPWDAAVHAGRRLRVDLDAMRWLPMEVLLEAGRFPRMQEMAHLLRQGMDDDGFYAFVSHRWLTASAPDPGSRQAASLAWQLVGYLAEAVRVAHQRGLTAPRLYNPHIGFPIGPQGSELAESLLVNLLRPALGGGAPDHDGESNPAGLDAVWREVREIDDRVSGPGMVAAGARDVGLHELRALLDECPGVRQLLGRVHLWYDYTCLPQPPRTDGEQELFRAGLETLGPCQVLGTTLVLLDDTDDYLGRAWCTLEALTGSAFGALHLLSGPERLGRDEDSDIGLHLVHLLEDRPHLIWRAVLDTELFGVQDQQQCMRRLGLAATDLSDLSFIYRRLPRRPVRVHLDDSELVTGVVPLAVMPGEDAVALPSSLGRDAGRAWTPLGRLDWWAAGDLGDGPRIDPWDWPPLRHYPSLPRAGSADVPSTPAHVAVVASCEGEAILVAAWVEEHRSELEDMLAVAVRSVSWVATDVAPVGCLAHGQLQATPVSAPVWVLVGLSQLLERAEVADMVIQSASAAGNAVHQVAIDITDEPHQNVGRLLEGASAGTRRVALPDGGFAVHVGGLFRHDLDSVVVREPAPT